MIGTTDKIDTGGKLAARLPLQDLERQIWAMEPGALRGLLGRFDQEESEQKQKARAERNRPTRAGSVAVVPVVGVIDQRAGWWSDVSTETLGTVIDELAASKNVSAIVLDVDSPGGTVYGTDELADKIFAARQRKPIVAVANAWMASGAYYLGSQATELVVTPTGEAGSIGVLVLHLDWSEALDKAGIKPTFVHAGKYKVEGNPYEPLDDETRAELQGQVDRYFEMFAAAVARGRKVPEARVKKDFGEGRMLGAREAVEAGMADRVATLDQVVSGLVGGKAKAAGRQMRTRQTEIRERELSLRKRLTR